MAKTPLEMLEGIGKKGCCGTCLYWDSFPSDVKEASVGKCRRYPPTLSIVADKTSIGPKVYLPVTMVGDWCGEHVIKEEIKDKISKNGFKETSVKRV